MLLPYDPSSRGVICPTLMLLKLYGDPEYGNNCDSGLRVARIAYFIPELRKLLVNCFCTSAMRMRMGRATIKVPADS